MSFTNPGVPWDIVDAYEDDKDLIAKLYNTSAIGLRPAYTVLLFLPSVLQCRFKKAGKRNGIFFVTKFGLGSGPNKKARPQLTAVGYRYTEKPEL